jgi:hypothetical protein
MEKIKAIPAIKWVYSKNDEPSLQGKIGSAKNNDPSPKPITEYFSPTGFISLSAKK